jgi:predicted phosphohydrolase
MLFAIADLHLSLGTEKPMDIFSGWENYVGHIENNWKKTVSDQDSVVIAGDISWAMSLDEAKKDFAFINSLPGEKIILKGNHDFWWCSLKKIKSFLKENNFSTIKILQNSSIETQGACICGTRGWNCESKNEQDKKISIRESERLKLSFESAKNSKLEKIVFLHYPPVYGKCESKLLDIIIENKIKKCYYGHVHGKSAYEKVITGEYQGVNLFFISCDFLKFCPKQVDF